MGAVQKAGITRTLGPLASLEPHLRGNWGQFLFSTDPLSATLESHQQWLQSFHDLMPHLDLREDHRVLDAACSSGSRCIEFARRGIRSVMGADRSPQRIETARKRAEQAGLRIEFHTLEHPARFSFPGGMEFDRALLLSNSLATGDHPAQHLLQQITNHLSHDGQLVLEVSDGDWLRAHFVPRSWHWIDDHHFVCHERSLATDGSRLFCREVLIHTGQGILADQIYTELLHPLREVNAMLDQAGFRVSSQKDLEPGRRILLTAEKAHQLRTSHTNGTVRAGAVRFKDITVLLGDPGRPDETKRGGVFNPDDLEVVAKLRNSITSLAEFRFTFLDKHDELIDQLQKKRPAFVLNLCDEGFQNIPTMELHVPALLEMLNIPYSGAAPACLALCYDKHATGMAAADLGIAAPKEVLSPNAEPPARLPSDFPLIVKPNYGDGSFGITRESVVHSQAELENYLATFRTRWPGQPALIQEFLPGREYTVALIGNPGAGFRMLPVVESDYKRLTPGFPASAASNPRKCRTIPTGRKSTIPKRI